MVDPAFLGIPDDVAQVAVTDTPPLTGDFVFLYSSQADQRSFEYPLDPADPQGRWQGAFTLALALARALRAESGASWTQVLAATRIAMQRGAGCGRTPTAKGRFCKTRCSGRVRRQTAFRCSRACCRPVFWPVFWPVWTKVPRSRFLPMQRG